MEQQPNPSSLRVLIRPPPPPTTATTSSSSSSSSNPPNPPPQNPSSLPSQHLPPKPSSSSSSSSTSSAPLEGVVVVGFIGSRGPADQTHLINRILDANVFGSGNLDKDLLAPGSMIGDHKEDWFRSRRISYYHDEGKGMVFLQFSASSPSPLMLSPSGLNGDGGDGGSASVLEECEADDLRAMLLMFSVCHVIIYLQEGLRFDTQFLKKFRMLQAAKHALAPFVRSHITPTLMSKASSSLSLPAAARAASVSPPGRRGAVTNRHASAISLMSGSGSHPSVLPGQCAPVILFVFVDEFLDGSNPLSNVEDLADASSLNQSSSLSGTPKSSLTSKGSAPVVMLARPISKAEGSYRKKLHASLESQIRFLIKKCRTLVGAEHSHLGSRGVGNVSSLPLFTLDSSRVVALLDRSINHRGEPLDFVTGLIEEVLNSKAASDMLMLENRCQTLNHEDIQSVKDFIFRQSDTLRGRGGLATNANSGSAVGVGMVAAAAAAAAASAAAGKPVSTPELPSLKNWLSSSNLILDVLLSIKHGFVDGSGNLKGVSTQRSATEVQDEQISPLGTSAIETAVSWLESNKGLNMKFSISWCQKSLPAAKKVYLKELPACYPTAMHKSQLEKALQTFHSMVKGPAVQMFAKKLEDECTLIWESGRQLCDAVSLTGKLCMHRRHNVEKIDSPTNAVIKQHSSGYFFLHACACGRSRRLRDDPFDFDSANILFSCFPNCENLLPSIVFPEGSNAGPIPPSSWSLVRLGGARYYEPSKGLLQSGFCSTENFLHKWTITLEKQRETSDLSIGGTHKGSIISSTLDLKAMFVVNEKIKKSDETTKADAVRLLREVHTGGLENQRKSSEIDSSDDSSISFGKGLPVFPMKKPFSEVVAGTVSVDSTIPLQQRKPSKNIPEKGARQVGVVDQNDDQVHVAGDRQGSQKTGDISVQENSQKLGTNGLTDGDPFVQIGSNIVPVNIYGSGKIKANDSLQQVILYVGFEHECSHGHRFLLSLEHLNDLDSSYSLPETSHSFTTEDSEGKYEERKNGIHEKFLPYSAGRKTTALNNKRKPNISSEKAANGSQQQGKVMMSTISGRGKVQFVSGLSVPFNSVEDLDGNLPYVRLDDGGCAFSLLNRNLPIYMNCPHCKNSTMDQEKIKFASTVSQLQRIFMVTPPFPTVLATCPVIQFEASLLPLSIPDRELQSRFSLGCRVILPPESFVSFRLPFVYGVKMDDGSLQPLNHLEHRPELTAWLTKGTTLQVVSKGHESDGELHMQ